MTRADRRLRSRCVYCGGRLVTGRVCAYCKPLQEGDPHAIAAGGPIGERELGLRVAWPEGEPRDDEEPT